MDVSKARNALLDEMSKSYRRIKEMDAYIVEAEDEVVQLKMQLDDERKRAGQLRSILEKHLYDNDDILLLKLGMVPDSDA